MIRQQILATLAYFDLNHCPLTQGELWQWLYNYQNETIAKDDFEANLSHLQQQNIIGQKQGYYFLRGREQIAVERAKREEWARKKRQRAKRLVNWWLRFLPWIKGVFLTGPVGRGFASQESDIDFLVVTEKGRIWLTRFLVVAPLKILNLRPTLRTKKNRFCFSYFITTEALNLSQTKINDLDIPLVYWLTSFQPVINRDQIWERFAADNKWIKEYVPNWQDKYKNENIERANELEQKKGNKWVDKIENWFKKLQLWYFPEELKLVMNLDKRVIVNDQMLKLHSHDSRAEEYLKWKNNIKRYEL